MEFTFFGRRKSQETLAPSGLEKYKQSCEELCKSFEGSFNPKDKILSQDMYNEAKRLFNILEGPMWGIAYGNLFRDTASALGEIPKIHLKERHEKAKEKGEEIRNLMLFGIDQSIGTACRIFDKQSLEIASGSILPFEAKYKGLMNFGGNSKYEIHHYIGQLREISSRLGGLKTFQQGEIQEVSGLYRSLIIDRDLLLAIYEDVISTDPRVYNFSFINNFKSISETLSKICATYEGTN